MSACERCGTSKRETAFSEILRVTWCGECFEAHADRAETARLLDDIGHFIRRFVVLPEPDLTADALALWVLHTHAFESSWATPYLRITSPAPDSGKTLLLEVLASISHRGWHAINPSVAVLFRKVDRDQPTLFLDEIDNYPLQDRKDALSVLNAGYKRGVKVPRCNERGELQEFGCYCPKAYAGLDDHSTVPTLLSRSITIRMETKLSSDHVEMWIAPLVEERAETIRVRCEEWSSRYAEHLLDIRPDLLELTNRRAEVWWALLAIGEYAGGEWLERARTAARTLGAGGDQADTPPAQIQLLTDIQAAFNDNTALFTKILLSTLNGLDESPWGARRKGEGLDPRGLAQILRPFGIKPRTVRVGDETAKGYLLEQFESVFARYLVPYGNVTSVTSVTSASRSHADVTDVTDVTGSVESLATANGHGDEAEIDSRPRASQGNRGSSSGELKVTAP